MSLLFRILKSLVYVPAFILFFGWIARSVRVYDSQIGIQLPLWTNITGIIFMILGALLVLVCILVFITMGKGTPAAFDPPVEFVASGPYAFVRNPMYIGGFILLVGFGLFHLSVSILILAIILFGVFHLFVVYYEEPTLEKQFGKSYTEYKSKVNRWIPGWR